MNTEKIQTDLTEIVTENKLKMLHVFEMYKSKNIDKEKFEKIGDLFELAGFALCHGDSGTAIKILNKIGGINV